MSFGGKKNITSNAYWDQVAGAVGSYYLIPQLAEYKNREYIRLFETWGVGPQGRVLVTDLYEAAHGNTGIYGYLCRTAREVLAMDISTVICRKAKDNLGMHGLRAGIVSGDATRIPFGNAVMDAIISPSTFDHFPGINAALAECHRILKPGGKLILALNSANNPFFRLGVRMAERLKRHEYQTDHFYTAKEIALLLGEAGFSMGRTTAIMHIPIGMTTILEALADSPWLGGDWIGGRWLKACESWGRRETGLKLFTGWWVVAEGIKK